MATTSEVKAGLSSIAVMIRAERKACENAKARIIGARLNLDSIPTKYAEILASVNQYTGSDAFELLSTAEISRMTTEFVALRDATDAAITSLDSITEF